MANTVNNAVVSPVAKTPLSNLTWGKIGSLIVAGLGLIVQYTPQLQDMVASFHLNPNIGIILTLIAGIATQTLSAIHSHQLEQLQNATPNDSSSVPVTKVGLFLIGFLLLGSAAQAQEGIAFNPNFAAPMQYVQTAGNNYVLLPTAGLSLSLGYIDVVNSAIQKSLCVFLEGNIGQTAVSGAPSVANAIVGLQGGFSGIDLTAGLQVAGAPLGGYGSSGFVIGGSYDLTQAIGQSGWLLKFK